MTDVIVHVLRKDAARLLTHEPEARAATIEGVHQMRRATRRLRGSLRVFRPWLDLLWLRGLGDELRWFARLLGEVRDLDVARARFSREPFIESSFDDIREALRTRRDDAARALSEAFGSPRYSALRARLSDETKHPWLRDLPQRDCRARLFKRLRRLARAFLKQGERALRHSEDEPLHALRKRGKDLRFGIDSLSPFLDRRRREVLERFSRKLTRLLDALGDRQDIVMARARLAALPGSVDADPIVLQQLDRELDHADRAVEKRWSELARGKSLHQFIA